MAPKKPIPFTLKNYAYLRSATSVPVVDERFTNRDWVAYGADNLHPQRMLDLIANVVPLASAVEHNALFIAGKKFCVEKAEGEPHEAALKLWSKWMSGKPDDQFRYRLGYDISAGNHRAIAVRYDSNGRIARLDHVDASRVRSGPINPDTLKPDLYYLCANWAKVNSRGVYADRYKPISIPVFNYAKGATDKIQLIYDFGYAPGADYYGWAWWLACVPDAEVWRKVPAYNLTQIETGFTATVLIGVPADLDAKGQVALQKNIEKTFTGSRGNNCFVYTHLPNGDKPTVTVLPRGNHAGELDTMRDKATSEIIKANMIPGILLDQFQPTGLSGQAPATIQQVQKYDAMLVQPKQATFIEQLAKELFTLEGFSDIEAAYVDTIKPFDGLPDESYLNSVSKNEHRVKVLGLTNLMLPDGKTEDPDGYKLLKSAAPAPQPTPQEEPVAP